jgi:hypothetical protein
MILFRFVQVHAAVPDLRTRPIYSIFSPKAWLFIRHLVFNAIATEGFLIKIRMKY